MPEKRQSNQSFAGRMGRKEHKDRTGRFFKMNQMTSEPEPLEIINATILILRLPASSDSSAVY
jgi:hypothetical protein